VPESPDGFDEPTQRLPRVTERGAGPWWRRGSTVAIAASFLAVVVLSGVAFALLRPDSAPALVDAGATTAIPSGPTATPSATGTPVSATPTVPPTPRVTRTQVPIPTERPSEPAPPPPPPAPPGPPPSTPPSSCTQWNPAGDAPREVVRVALAEAGARQYWVGVSKPKGWPAESPYPPVITIPANLMYAVAWTESDWRSTVIACDGGIGLMQVMPDTAPWMNQRFNRSYSVSTVDGNAAIGAMYLEWLTMYFGLYYFGAFDLETVAPLGPGGANVKLGDVVIAAYNVGYAAVENLNGTPESADDTLSIPNQWYVDRVRRFQQQRPWEVPTTPPTTAPPTSAPPSA
jgi:hypothetical protein